MLRAGQQELEVTEAELQSKVSTAPVVEAVLPVPQFQAALQEVLAEIERVVVKPLAARLEAEV